MKRTRSQEFSSQELSLRFRKNSGIAQKSGGAVSPQPNVQSKNGRSLETSLAPEPVSHRTETSGPPTYRDEDSSGAATQGKPLSEEQWQEIQRRLLRLEALKCQLMAIQQSAADPSSSQPASPATQEPSASSADSLIHRHFDFRAVNNTRSLGVLMELRHNPALTHICLTAPDRILNATEMGAVTGTMGLLTQLASVKVTALRIDLEAAQVLLGFLETRKIQWSSIDIKIACDRSGETEAKDLLARFIRVHADL